MSLTAAAPATVAVWGGVHACWSAGGGGKCVVVAAASGLNHSGVRVWRTLSEGVAGVVEALGVSAQLLVNVQCAVFRDGAVGRAQHLRHWGQAGTGVQAGPA